MLSIALRVATAAVAFAGISLLAFLHSRRCHSELTAAQPRRTPEPQPIASTQSPTRPSTTAQSTPAGASATSDSTPRGIASVPSTTHGRLVLDGYFARQIGLIAAMRTLKLPGRSIEHTPHDYLLAALVNVLAGHEQLQQVSRGENPLRPDLLVAEAWEQRQFPEVSGVCRQLHALDWVQAEALREQLRQVFAPYVALCAGPLQARGERLQVDWDLTAKQITTDAETDPFAAYGHMESDLGRGYQWAETSLRGVGPDHKPRPVMLGGFLSPGNTHPTACMERLGTITESTLGRPRRRPDLQRVHIAVGEAAESERQSRVDDLRELVDRQLGLVNKLRDQVQAVEQRQAQRSPKQTALRARDERALTAVQARLEKASTLLAERQKRLEQATQVLTEAHQQTVGMRERLAKLEAENAALDAANQRGIAVEIFEDCQFSDSERIAYQLEAGYHLTTKARSQATMTKLLAREAKGEQLFGQWKEVSANAEVAECAETHYAKCPHPLRLLGYRKHLAASTSRPARTTYALFITSVPAPERTAEEVVREYHRRGGTVELSNREVKSDMGWRGQRLRHGPGLDVVTQFTFAGLNFVRWLADTVWAEAGSEAGKRPGLAELTRMARAPAQLLADEGGVAVHFTDEDGRTRRTLTLHTLRQPPLPGFVWPGVPIHAQLALQN